MIGTVFSMQNIEEVFAISQIADYMISSDISAHCDALLSDLSVSTDDVLPVLLFSEKYLLPTKTIYSNSETTLCYMT